MSVESVREYLSRMSFAGDIVTLPSTIQTVDLAAAALGVKPEQIAKSLAIRVKNRTLVIVCKGTARLDNAKFKNRFSGKGTMLSGEECLLLTGHPPGGVCPFGLNAGAEVFLDCTLKEFDEVFPAAGAVDNCIRVTVDELARLTAGEWVDVCR